MPVTGPAALDERPRRRRAALLAAPWALALALGVAALAARPGASAAPDPAPSPATTAAAPTALAQPVPSTAPIAPDTVPAATHLQVLAQARIALGTAGLASEAGSRADQWPIEVRLAGVSPVTDTLAIATVHALVIELADGTWTGPVARAVAVPLTLSPEPHVAGPAWPIAAPPSAVVAPDGDAVAEPDPAVLVPLEQAGWSVDELTAVELVDGAVLRIELIGAPPGDTERGRHAVWLLDAPGGPRLLPLEPLEPPQPPQPPQPPEPTETTQEST